MILWNRLRSILHWIFRRRHAERQLDAELQAYIEIAAADKLRSGLTREEALRMAKVELGGMEQIKEHVRTGRHGALLDSLWQEIRLGWRSLKANPRYALVSFLTIAVTIAGVSMVFTLVDSVLLKPLPYPDSRRLLSITQTSERSGMTGFTFVSGADMRDILEASPSLEAIGLYRSGYVYTLDPDTDPKRIAYWSATSDLFSVLDIRAIRGRGLLPEDDKPESRAVAVIGYDLWQWRFAGREDIVGQSLVIPRVSNGRDDSLQFEIVGVLPPDFKLPFGGLTGYPSFCTALQLGADDLDRRNASYIAIARLRSDATLESAQSELEAASKHLAEAYPDTSGKRKTMVAPLLHRIVGDTREILWIFFGAVFLVLLIGVANLANLQIVRNSAREREISIRAALGASRSRLIRQLLMEALLLSGTAGAFGYFLAHFGVQLVVSNLPAAFPRADQIALNGSVLLFTLGLSLLVGVLVGLVPAWRISRSDFHPAFNEGSRHTMGARRGRLQQTLIAAEVAFAFILLVGAGLLMNSFIRLFTTDAGFSEDHLWTASVRLPLTYRDSKQTISTWRSLLDQIRLLPEVVSATVGVNSSPMLSGSDIMMGGLMPDGKAGDPRRDGVTLSNRPVGPDYFSTIGVSILRGRSIIESDTATSERVVVLNEAGAHALWPDSDALGKRIRFGKDVAYTVVGVVSNFRHRRLNEEPVPQMYTSYQQDQSAFASATFMVRLKSKPEGFAAAAQSIVSRTEAKATITLASQSEIRWKLVAAERFRTTVLLVFAFTAAFLSLVGIFGVVSYSVVQRNREIGLRMALGAAPGTMLQMAVRQAMVPSLIGFSLGLAGSLALTRLLTAFVFRIRVTDPLTFAGTGLVLLVAAFFASYLPGRRATLVDPVIALRHE